MLASKRSASSSGASTGDGFYVRFSSSKDVMGPLAYEDFQSLIRSSGDLVDSGSVSAWKQACGQAFKIDVTSAFSRRKLLSCESLGQLMELFLVVMMLISTGFAFSLVDWKKESAGTPAKLFLFILTAVTLVASFYTIRVVIRRWRRASTTVKAVEEVV